MARTERRCGVAREHYLVFDGDDWLNASLCLGHDNAVEIVRMFDAPRVWRVTLDEFCRDVSDEFITPAETDELAGSAWDHAASAGERERNLRIEGAA